MKNTKFAIIVLAVVATLSLTHCGSKTDTSGAGSNTFTGIYNSTLSQTCVDCHKPGGSATTSNNTLIDFSSKAQAYASLAGATVHGITSTSHCGGVLLVNTSTVAYSYILGTLIPSYSNSNFGGAAGCTPYAGHAPLSQAEQDDLIAWINAGAQNN